MLISDDIAFFAACEDISGMGKALEEYCVEFEDYERAAYWRDTSTLLACLSLATDAGELVEIEEAHIIAVLDSLILSALNLNGAVEVHLVNKSTGEVTFFFGDDRRLDFALDKQQIKELREMKIFSR